MLFVVSQILERALNDHVYQFIQYHKLVTRGHARFQPVFLNNHRKRIFNALVLTHMDLFSVWSNTTNKQFDDLSK